MVKMLTVLVSTISNSLYSFIYLFLISFFFFLNTKVFFFFYCEKKYKYTEIEI